ncbi:hypothetical protein IKF02_04070 [Candidatus Saccharibacteria bacterium]|nr:hypothetical protein [Candidatus Saccharibacteria bacterium]
MSGEDYNAEKTQNESPMAELANEADNFDPEKAEKARAEREAIIDAQGMRTSGYTESDFGKKELDVESDYDRIAGKLERAVQEGRMTKEHADKLLERQLNSSIDKIDSIRQDFEDSKTAGSEEDQRAYEQWLESSSDLEVEPIVEEVAATETISEQAESDELGAEDNGGDLYSGEYREQKNAPTIDLFTKRRKLIEEQFSALKPLSPEEIRRYLNDPAFQEEIDQARAQVPKGVAEEHDLLGRMVGRLEAGIGANLTPDHPWANSEPNYVPTELAEEGYEGMVVTRWKAEESKKDLERMRELHEKNSEIIDFSRENEVDIDTVPEELQAKIESISSELEALESAELSDFESHGDNRPKASATWDKIFQMVPAGLSYAARKELRKKSHEFQKQYMEAKDAAELRNIDSQMARLQQEKAEIEERQKQYEDANVVTKLFNRMFNSKRREEEETRAGNIYHRMQELQERAGRIRGKNNVE